MYEDEGIQCKQCDGTGRVERVEQDANGNYRIMLDDKGNVIFEACPKCCGTGWK